MKIAIGCDEAAFDMKETIKRHLTQGSGIGVEVEDFGVFSRDPVDYPDIAEKVAEAIVRRRCDRGILLCGTGIGMCIAANKVPGVRAALCHDTYSAERAQKSNNAQILTLVARVSGEELAKKIVDAWMSSNFSGGPSAAKVDKIMRIEAKYRGTRGPDGR
jgi:ribose 5-phosphate isomerase B